MGVLALAVTLFCASGARAENLLVNGGFERGTSLPSNWTLTGGGANWGFDTGLFSEGVRSLRLNLPASNTATGSTRGNSANIGGLGGTRVRLSGSMRSAGLTQNSSRFAAQILLVGDGFTETMAEYDQDSQRFIYFEQEVQIPPGIGAVRVDIVGYGANGSVWFDGLALERVSEVAPPDTEPYWWPAGAADAWASPTSHYRYPLQIEGAAPGDPVLVNLDPQRLLLDDGNRQPLDIGSVRVFARLGDGSTTRVTAVFDSPLSSLAFHYPMDGFLRFRALAGASDYTLYFNTAGATGVHPPADNPHLGIGERLRYAETTANWLWGGWNGDTPAVLDVDGDGDHDLYLGAFDGLRFLARNVGSNAAPLFLPRSRPLTSDTLVQPAGSPWAIDWDGDGDLDRATVLTQSTGDGSDGVDARVRVQFNTAGVYGSPVVIQDAAGTPLVLEKLGLWAELVVADVDNDGKDDLLLGSAQASFTVLLNRGVASGVPRAEASCLRVAEDVIPGCLSEDMALKGTAVDWDGDGDDDLIVTGWQGFVFYLENEGQANTLAFKPGVKLLQQGGPVATADCAAPCAVDWDNDGDLDLLIGSITGHLMMVRNVGTATQPELAAGVFLKDTRGQLIQLEPSARGGTIQGYEESYWGYLSVESFDWDQDGDLDLVINDSLGRLSWIENIGTRAAPVLAYPYRRLQTGVDLTSGLVAHWKFEDNYLDASGNGNTLSVVGSAGAPGFADGGVAGRAVVLNNATAPQGLARNLTFGTTDSITLSAWVKPTVLQDGFTTTSPHTVGAFYHASNANRMEYRIRDGKPDVYQTNPAANYPGNTALTVGVWNHVVYVQNRNTLKMYLNGTIVEHYFPADGLVFNRFILGTTLASSQRGLQGQLDEVRLYRRELSDNDVAALYAADLGGAATTMTLPLTTPWRNRPGVGDLDGDGLADVVLLDNTGRLGWYERDTTQADVLRLRKFLPDATGKFFIASVYKNNALGRTQLDLGDWDGDGQQDLLCGQDWVMHGGLSSVWFYRNTGTNAAPVIARDHLMARGTPFIEWTGHNGINNGHSAHPEMADWNHDGTPDLLVGTESGRVTWYTQDYFTGTAFPTWAPLALEKQNSAGQILRRHDAIWSSVAPRAYLGYE